MKYIYLLSILYISNFALSQNNRFSIEANYGLSGSPRVVRYTERAGEGNPAHPENRIFLADKDFFGSVGQIQLNYHLKNNTTISIGYSRDMHQRERNYQNSYFYVDNFSIRHNNNIYFIKHKRNFSKSLKYHFGGFVKRPEQQEIEIWEPNGPISVQERDAPNNRLSDGGLLAGIDYEKQIDTHFVAGLHLSGYYLASASTYETTYLTGSLAYQFGK